jgi:glycerol-3-phosphate dehydrogenase (NAD(P)+)
MMAKVVILGAGVMGSAMAIVAADRGHRVELVGTHLDDQIIRSIEKTKLHPTLGTTLPSAVRPHRWDRFAQALEGGAELLILGISSAGVPWAIDRMVEADASPVPVLMVTKGLASMETHFEVLPEFVAQEFKKRIDRQLPVIAIGGPCIALAQAGLSRRHEDRSAAECIQRRFCRNA